MQDKEILNFNHRLLSLHSFYPYHMQCCGSGMFFRIPDPTFFHPGSQIQIFSIPDPDTGFRSKNLSILTPKNDFQALGNMVVHSVSRIRILTFYPSQIPDTKPGSATLTTCYHLQIGRTGCHIYACGNIKIAS